MLTDFLILVAVFIVNVEAGVAVNLNDIILILIFFFDCVIIAIVVLIVFVEVSHKRRLSLIFGVNLETSVIICLLPSPQRRLVLLLYF